MGREQREKRTGTLTSDAKNFVLSWRTYLHRPNLMRLSRPYEGTIASLRGRGIKEDAVADDYALAHFDLAQRYVFL